MASRRCSRRVRAATRGKTGATTSSSLVDSYFAMATGGRIPGSRSAFGRSEESLMRMLKLSAILAFAICATSAPLAARLVPTAVGPSFSSIGPLAFGPTGVLFAADRQAATIFALDLGTQSSSGTTGTAAVPKLDERIAAVLGAA